MATDLNKFEKQVSDEDFSLMHDIFSELVNQKNLRVVFQSLGMTSELQRINQQKWRYCGFD